jgi:HlyD family secretion protein
VDETLSCLLKMSLSSRNARRIAVVTLVATGVLIYSFAGRQTKAKLVTAPVTRGSIVRSVSATGTVNPVITVQVGSYVSGPIQAIYADYNSPVKKGQLIAKIDPRPFEVKTAEGRATLNNSKAQLGKDKADMAYKKLSYQRNSQLLKSGAISRDTVDSASSAYQQAVAQVELDKAKVEEQEATLKEAQVNLDYTNILSPVDGTVVSRNVDVGQTVAASFQTPTLFLIAKDLTQMQVDSNVSESDIGNVQLGQNATFKVDAFPEREFEGAVIQVRQAPITVQNVVTYDVVVGVANPEQLLKPGMTANLTIVTARRDDVLRVPVQALRFHPDGVAHHHGNWGSQQNASGSQMASNHIPRKARIWLDDSGKMTPVAVVTGLDDGTNVEIRGGQVQPGQLVVTDQVKTGDNAPARSSSGGPPRMPRF